MYSAEVPYRGAKNGAFPQILNKLNRNDVPINSLWFTGLVVQLCLFLVLLTGKTYDALLLISTSMILVPYLLIGAYLLKLSFQQSSHWYIKFTGFMATLYALWIFIRRWIRLFANFRGIICAWYCTFFFTLVTNLKANGLISIIGKKALLAIFAILFIWAIKVLMNFEF
ncbi:Putative Arginine/ornithine antiporter [Avibacterium paragallinarum JF4211]|nr:Putative Arginine/ornithine antiporter [Avibacterium paragallinarum JF4211]